MSDDVPAAVQEFVSSAKGLRWNDVLWSISNDPELLDWRDTEGHTLLWYLAPLAGSQSCIAYLEERGLKESETALGQMLERCMSNDQPLGLRTIDAFNQILGIGASPNARSTDRSQFNLLQIAIVDNNVEFMESLLTAGADPTVLENDWDPRSSLQLAGECSSSNRAAKRFLEIQGQAHKLSQSKT